MILKLIKTVYLYGIQMCNRIAWAFQYFFVKKELEKCSHIPYGNFSFKRGVFIVPHADDELFGAYTFIKRHRDNIVLLYIGMTGSNKTAENKTARRKEFVKLCTEEGFRYNEINSFDKDVLSAIKEWRADTVFLPSYIDWHDEHRQINELALSAFKESSFELQIVWYQITVPIKCDNYNCFLEQMEKHEQDEKYRAFRRYYPTQNHMPTIRFRYNERLSGIPFGCYAGEKFMMLGFDDWEKLIEFLTLADYDAVELIQKIKKTKDMIDNIKLIHKASEKVYQNCATKLMTDNKKLWITSLKGRE